MKSNNLKIFASWLATATPEQIEFVDSVYHICEEHYCDGGDTIVECYDPPAILERFDSIKEVQEYCGLMLEKAADCRWGEDDDPEVKALDNFRNSGEW